MKLCEMNTDQLSDALCELADPIERICKDAEMNEKIKALSKDAQNGMTMLEKMGRTVAIWLPALLKTRRADTYKVLSVLTDKSVEEIAAQNGFETIKMAQGAMNKELLGFFKLFAGMA